MFETLAQSARARAAQAGRSTLTRTAYLLTLSSRSGEGAGESGGLLADVVRQLREGIDDVGIMTSQFSCLFEARDKLDSALSLVDLLKAVQFDRLQSDAGMNGVYATLEAISGLLSAALDQTQLEPPTAE